MRLSPCIDSDSDSFLRGPCVDSDFDHYCSHEELPDIDHGESNVHECHELPNGEMFAQHARWARPGEGLNSMEISNIIGASTSIYLVTKLTTAAIRSGNILILDLSSRSTTTDSTHTLFSISFSRPLGALICPSYTTKRLTLCRSGRVSIARRRPHCGGPLTGGIGFILPVFSSLSVSWCGLQLADSLPNLMPHSQKSGMKRRQN